jgi:aspartyl-tRNA(Asn)/glutamyl-tRNA(Gln) amidotransferase subunit A
MTRTARDAALMMDVISKPDNRDWHALQYDGAGYTRNLGTSLKGLRIAYSPDLGYVNVDPEIAALVCNAVKVLKSLGAKVTEVNPGFTDPADTFRTLWWSGARYLLGQLSAEKKALLDPALADVVEQGAAITPHEIFEANRKRGELGALMRGFMEDYDALITPTLPVVPFGAGLLQPDNPDNRGKWVNWTPFTYPFNLTQQPAASSPCGFTKAGLPAGLHVIGKMFDDRTVLKICAAFEAATDFHNRKPNGF